MGSLARNPEENIIKTIILLNKTLRIIILVQMLCLSVCTFAVTYPKHEVRAVWLTTIGGLDWPHSYASTPTSIERQKSELCRILDQLHRANINTILLQTRVRATSIFPTTSDSYNEPWDGCLSGVPGKSPGYDALQFAIDECHRRGMELHAWVVTIPVGKWNGYGCKTLRKTFPDLVIKIGDEGYMNPADNRTAQYLARYCSDIVRRYDVDGIHLDYIRYPETMKKLPKADEGRRNITRIVKAIHDAVKVQKPWVKMSCSPIGKHDDTRRFWSHGWNARSRVFQDAKEWMRTDLMDMEFPMMYFRGNNFYPFAIDWQEGTYGKMMVPGLGIYFMHPKEQNWKLEDITRELYVLRQQGMGFCMFRSKFFTDNTKGLYDFVCKEFCRYPSLVPPTSCSRSECTSTSICAKCKAPLPPTTIKVNKQGTLIEWGGAEDRSDGDYLMYNVYTSDTYPVDTQCAENLLATYVYGNRLKLKSCGYRFYAVTAIDRYGRESLPCQMPGARIPTNVKPGWYWVTHPLGK